MRVPGSLAILLVATATARAHPGSGIALDRRGQVIFVDTGGGVFRITAPGRLEKLPGPAFHWMALDPENRFTGNQLSTSDAEIKAVGRDPTVILSSDYPVAITADGALVWPQRDAGGRVQLIRLSPSGARDTIAAVAPELQWLNGVTFGAGAIHFTENAAVRRVDGGRVVTVAENVTVPGCVRPAGHEEKLGAFLRGLAVAADGTVYVAASQCGAVLAIPPKGAPAVLLRASPPYTPTGVVAGPDGIYVLEYSLTAGDDRREWLPRVRKVGADGKVTTLATVEKR